MATQQIYLRDFMTVVRQHCPTRVITSLSLPSISDASLRIVMQHTSGLLHQPLNYYCIGPSATRVCGLQQLVYEA